MKTLVDPSGKTYSEEEIFKLEQESELTGPDIVLLTLFITQNYAAYTTAKDLLLLGEVNSEAHLARVRKHAEVSALVLSLRKVELQTPEPPVASEAELVEEGYLVTGDCGTDG